MKPHPVEGLDSVNASYYSVRGMIKSRWQTRKNEFDWHISIPANTTATVYVPAEDKNDVTESGKELENSKGVKFIKMEGERAVIEIKSGDYHFVSIE